MRISRVTLLTLGVDDLGKATEFYEAVLYLDSSLSN